MENKIIIASSHRDKHRHRMMPSALEQMKEIINGEKGVQITIEHNRTLPPLGQMTDAETIVGNDGETFLMVKQKYFDEEFTLFVDGERLIGQRFSEGGRPFNSIDYEVPEKIEIGVDNVNLGNTPNGVENFKQSIVSDSDYEFDIYEFGRKSEIPDPEIILKLTPAIALYLLALTSLFGFSQKFGEKMGEELPSKIKDFYKFLKVISTKIASVAIPSLRPITYIILIPGQLNIELIIKTSNPDDVTIALQKDILKGVSEKINSLMKITSVDKIQFIYDENKAWKFNYLLSSNDEVIGTYKAYDNRAKFIQSMASGNLLTDPNL